MRDGGFISVLFQEMGLFSVFFHFPWAGFLTRTGHLPKTGRLGRTCHSPSGGTLGAGR